LKELALKDRTSNNWSVFEAEEMMDDGSNINIKIQINKNDVNIFFIFYLSKINE
jgi:hypothetical protein